LRKFGLFLLVILLYAGVSAMRAADGRQAGGKLTIEYVMTMMDHSAENFNSLTAAIEHIKYTAVVKDTSTETGEIFVRKDQKVRIDFQSPDPRTIIRNGDNLYIYTPKINRVEEYNIGKNRAVADQYLALGFGRRADDLRKNFSITLVGEEDLDGHKAALIELVPHSEEMSKQVSKIQMWVDEASWMPVQQKFFEAGSDDYVISRYTKVLKNLKLGDGKFKPDWPKKGTKVEKPNS
jgi:outer membrane lipoprotein-sorting protein